MTHQRSGRLRWDTTHAATLGWLLFLDGQPGEAPTMLPEFETSLPRKASQAEVARPTCRKNGRILLANPLNRFLLY